MQWVHVIRFESNLINNFYGARETLCSAPWTLDSHLNPHEGISPRNVRTKLGLESIYEREPKSRSTETRTCCFGSVNVECLMSNWMYEFVSSPNAFRSHVIIPPSQCPGQSNPRLKTHWKSRSPPLGTYSFI
jgi:hypothetical protein